MSSEQARSQKLTAEVERLNRKLQRAEDELKARTDSLKQSEEKVETISRRLQKHQSLLISPDMSHQDESPEPEAGAPRCHPAGEPERELRERVTELEKEVRVLLMLLQVCLMAIISLKAASFECDGFYFRTSLCFFNLFLFYIFISAHQF